MHLNPRRVLSLAGIAALAFLGPSIPEADAEALDGSGLEDARVDLRRYDEVQQATVHNAYALGMPLDEQLRRGARSVEIDAWRTKRFHRALDDDFYVYHVDIPLLDGSVCARMSGCLDQIASFHRASPRHAVLTVFLDVKDPLLDGGDTLDALVRARFDEKSILTPRDLVASCEGARDLRDAVSGRCQWPTVESMRGKVMFVLTGGNVCQPGARLAEYANGGLDRRVGFIAPNVDETCATHRESSALANAAVFFNLDYDHRDEALAIKARHAVGRVYYGGVIGGLDAPWSWNAAKRAGAQFLATDRLDWR
jgi:hypothetical protein